MAFFEIRNLVMIFGGLVALHELGLEVKQGEIFGLIGPNGAGKSTLFNCINGFYKPQKGSILLEDKEMTRLPPHKISLLGIGRTYQNVELFRQYFGWSL